MWELVTCVQFLEEECAQMAICFMPEILYVDRDSGLGDSRHLPTVPFYDVFRHQRNPFQGYFGNFLSDSADRVQASFLLLLRISTAGAISGFIPGVLYLLAGIGLFLLVLHLIIVALFRLIFFITLFISFHLLGSLPE